MRVTTIIVRSYLRAIFASDEKKAGGARGEEEAAGTRGRERRIGREGGKGENKAERRHAEGQGQYALVNSAAASDGHVFTSAAKSDKRQT